MASIRDLKKDINFVLGDIIEAVQIKDLEKSDSERKKGDQIIEEAITVFDDLTKQINKKGIENPKVHYKAVRKSLEEKTILLIQKVNEL